VHPTEKWLHFVGRKLRDLLVDAVEEPLPADMRRLAEQITRISRHDLRLV
jgi:hypothetical protein